MITREVLLPVQFGLYARPATTLADVRQVLDPPARRRPVPPLAGHATCPTPRCREGGSTAAAAAVEVASQDSRLRRGHVRPDRGRAPPAAGGGRRDRGQLRRRHPVRAGGEAGSGRRSRPEPTRPPWCCSCGRTTPVPCWRSWSSSRAGGRTCAGSSPGRPGGTLGDYCFSVDAEGHVADARMAEAMMGLHRICADVVFLGSYPRADGPSRTSGPAPPNATTPQPRPGWPGSAANPSVAAV